ncbi:hypothetical protein L0F63_006641 [Massospora cicadina]|nr:hypothetical protein L0F63_006641 [Massospora cicadina]
MPTPILLPLLGVFILVCSGGLITGLTLGLMSLDKTNLHILSHSGTEQQKRTLVFESLPILVQSLGWGSGAFSVLLSTLLTLIFGEVVPQAICSRHGLQIGAAFAWPVQILIWIMQFCVAYPVASLLDWMLGESHGVMYHRAGGFLTLDEVTIISGALDLSSKVAANAMTHRRHVFMVDLDSQLDWVTLRDIQRSGHSRVPVFEGNRDNVIGLLLVKMYPIPRVIATMSLFELLNSFQKGASHMAVVMDSDSPDAVPLGIVTLEDVIEELIQEEIVDETDVYVDVVKRIRAVRAAVSVPPAQKNPSQPPPQVGESTPLLPPNARANLFSTPKSSVELHRNSSVDPEHARTHLRPGTVADSQADELNTTHGASQFSGIKLFSPSSY